MPDQSQGHQLCVTVWTVSVGLVYVFILRFRVRKDLTQGFHFSVFCLALLKP